MVVMGYLVAEADNFLAEVAKGHCLGVVAENLSENWMTAQENKKLRYNRCFVHILAP